MNLPILLTIWGVVGSLRVGGGGAVMELHKRSSNEAPKEE